MLDAGARVGPPGRHRSRRRLGWRSVGPAAATRAQRAAAPGGRPVRPLHADDPRGVVDFAAVVASLLARLITKAAARSSTSTSPTGWPLEDPALWAIDPRGAAARALSRRYRFGVGRRSGAGKRRLGADRARWRGQAAPASLPRRPALAGDGVGGVQGAQVGPAEAAVGRETVAVDLEEVDDGAVGFDDAHTVLDRRRDVEASLGVEAEAIAATAARRSITHSRPPSGSSRCRPTASTTTSRPSRSSAMPLQ